MRDNSLTNHEIATRDSWEAEDKLAAQPSAADHRTPPIDPWVMINAGGKKYIRGRRTVTVFALTQDFRLDITPHKPHSANVTTYQSTQRETEFFLQMNDPGVTVAITCFNHGQFLAQAIQSVQNQSLPSIEIIVIDDGSTDNTKAVASQFHDVRYHWQTNGGLSSARNAAISLAQGGFILFLDADDVLLPCALHEGMKAMAAHPDVAFVYGGYEEVSVSRHRSRIAPQEHDDPFESLLRWNFIGMHGTVIYNTQVLRESGGFDPSLTVCEDWDVYLRLARHYEIRPYFCIAAEYLRLEGSLSNKDPLRMLDTARSVLLRQQDLSEEQEGAVAAGLRGVTKVYSLIAASNFLSKLRERRYRDAIKLAQAAGNRDMMFPVHVFLIGLDILRRHLSRSSIFRSL